VTEARGAKPLRETTSPMHSTFVVPYTEIRQAPLYCVDDVDNMSYMALSSKVLSDIRELQEPDIMDLPAQLVHFVQRRGAIWIHNSPSKSQIEQHA
jgi:hypothetical protein